MRPTVLVLRTRYPHWGGYSGIGQVLRYLDAAALDLLDRPVSDGDADFPIRSELVRAPLRRIVKARGMPWYGLSDLRAELHALRRALSGACDVIHYFDAEHTAQYLPGLLARAPRLRTRTVATFHQPPNELAKLVRRSVVERLTHVVLMSPDQRSFFEGLLPADRISVIPHGVDVDFFHPGEPSRTPTDSETLQCLCVGHYLRDFRALGAVARRLSGDPRFRFRVVSSQPTGLEALGNVSVESGLDDRELREAYQGADVLFLPLQACTANNALLEGAACGLPVVSSDHASIRFYLPGEEAVLIRENDPDGFAEALLDLREHPERRARMSLAARQRAEELRWSRIAPRYQKLYVDLSGASDKIGNHP